MKRWLKQSKAPAEVERLLKAAAGIAGTEVEACFECERPGFVSNMVDLSSQEAPLLLCESCHAYRQRLRAMTAAHEPTRQYSCLCGWPIDSPIHERIKT